MRLFNIFIFLLISPFSVIGQLDDDFSDGDFTNNPTWMGHTAQFIINADGQLQLNADDAGLSNLVTAVNFPDSIVWDFWLEMDFAPSQTNRLRVYLFAESEQVDSTDAIILQIGENGSDDAIEIYQRINQTESLLAAGPAGQVAQDPINLHIHIEKSASGHWSVSADLSGGNSLSPIVSWMDNTMDLAGDHYFGFSCNYSATRVDKFFFDNILITPIIPDLTGPELLFAQANIANEIILQFDELLDQTSLSPTQFSITPDIGTPADVDFVETDSSQVILFLSQDLTSGQTYQVTATGVMDRHGNAGNGQADFQYIQLADPEAYDLLINELLPDPSPSVGLPEKEFIELHNTSTKHINLQDVSLSVNTTTRSLSDAVIGPNEFIIICDVEDTSDFSAFGPVMGIDLPALSNSGADIALQAGGLTIHQLSYDITSYGDGQKDDGGWTLELINPDNACLLSNLRVSESLAGGTPGQTNSVMDLAFGSEGIFPIHIFPQGNQSIVVTFSQVPGETAYSIDNYSISPGNIHVSSIQPNDASSILLTLDAPLESGTVYEMTILAGISNCIGALNTTQYILPTGLAGMPDRNDIIINEILFNPVTGGYDYVELFNNSDKIFQLSDCQIANLYDVPKIENLDVPNLIFPNQHIAFSENPTQIISHFLPPDTAFILKNNLPSYNDDIGNVSLLYDGLVIDSMNYSKDDHLPIITDDDGVALERISPDGASSSSANWISGASTTQYGTPGYRNAQHLIPIDGGTSKIQIDQTVFSPNGDGYQDVVYFTYALDQPGAVLQAKIYDEHGRFIARLLNNELLGQSGAFLWDGSNDLGELQPEGIYVIRFELFYADGRKEHIFHSCAIVWP